MAHPVSPGKRPKKALMAAVALALAAAFPPSAAARLNISPATISVRLDKERPSGTFNLTNLGDKTERYRAKAIHFDLSDDGSLDLPQPDALSLAPWVRFNPTEFEVPPNATRVIRYTILAPKNLPRGEYWGGIEFVPLEGALSTASDDEGRTFNITVVTAALVTIFGQVGDIPLNVSLSHAGLRTENDSTLLDLQLQNSGDGKVNLLGGEYRILDERGAAVTQGTLSEFPLLRGGKRNLTLRLDSGLAPGQYQVKLQVKVRQLPAPVDLQAPVVLAP
ncbi:MAG: hypothetical protein ACYDA8_06000 [Deferrisomatales bacterium]